MSMIQDVRLSGSSGRTCHDVLQEREQQCVQVAGGAALRVADERHHPRAHQRQARRVVAVADVAEQVHRALQRERRARRRCPFLQQERSLQTGSRAMAGGAENNIQ